MAYVASTERGNYLTLLAFLWRRGGEERCVSRQPYRWAGGSSTQALRFRRRDCFICFWMFALEAGLREPAVTGEFQFGNGSAD